MYKILIIDDEPVIRKGLKNIISWSQYGCEVCGEAADGIEGIEMVEECSPDIIFTDICMPEMDGLEMIKQIVNSDRHIKIIILTGYCDFPYVKEALVLGAFDYMLKPTKLNEIKDVIKRAVKDLDRDKEAMILTRELKEKYQNSLPKLREKLLFEVMMGITFEKSEIEKRKKNLNFYIEDYVMLLANSGKKSNSPEDLKYGTLQTFEEMLREDYEIYSIAIDDCNVAFIVCMPSETDKIQILKRCKELQAMMRDNLNMNVDLAISEKAKGIEGVFLSYGQCLNAAEGITSGPDTSFEVFSESDDSKMQHSDVKLTGLGRLLMDTIPFGSVSMTMNSLENLYNEATALKEKNAEVERKLKQIADDLSKAAEGGEYRTSEEATFEGLFADIRRLAEKAAVSARQNSKEDIKLVTKKAIEYLKKNYHRQVTLNEVAGAVYVSPFYISRMFKKETGKTMTEYLNDLRIDNACILLEDLQYKVYQVGEMVGISDAHYFSRMFKNSLGVTPSEYRNKLKVEQ